MKFEYWLSHKLQLRKGAKPSTSTGVIIAVAGVALALMVMEISLAVAVGFKNEIQRKVMGFDAPISVLPAYNYQTAESAQSIHLSDTLQNIITSTIPGAQIVETVKRHAILKTDNDFAAVQCIGQGETHNFDFEQGNIIEGQFPDYASGAADDSIVISRPLANTLLLELGDKVYMYFFADGEVKTRRAFIAGLYESNFGEYDNNIIYASINRLQRLSNDTTAVSSIDIEGITNPEEIVQRSETLQNVLIDSYRTGDIKEVYPVNNVLNSGAIFFNWLDLLDTNVVIIFILMLCVAMFTLISSLFIIILDRVPTIGILRALGASKRSVARIFVNIAMRLVGMGMLIGNVIGIGLIIVQQHTHFLPLNPQMYYLSYVPVELDWLSIILLNIGLLVGAWLTLILPAQLAARIDPAQTMRYE